MLRGTMNYETQLKSDAASQEASLSEDALRKRRLFIIAVCAVAVVVILGYLAMKMFGTADAGADANGQQAQTVSVALARSQTVTTMINSTGTISAVRDMPVGIVGEGGKVSAVKVEPGSWVGQGQVLAVIERSVQTQELASLSAQVEVMRADAKLAQSNLDRAKALVANGFVSKADIDQKTATRDAAVARVNVAIATLNQARARVGRLDVRAPAAGLVLTRTVEPGQIVSGGSGVLFRIAEGGKLEAQARLSESDLAAIKVGGSATVTLPGDTRSFTGTVWQISPVIDPTSRLGVARIALPFDEALRPGGFANVQIAAGSANAPILPEGAVQSDAQGAYVYIVGAGNKVQRRSVKTGPVTAAGIPILTGLKSNDKVVLYAAGFLNPGEVVKPKIQTAETAQPR